jgi:hypothetical protein
VNRFWVGACALGSAAEDMESPIRAVVDESPVFLGDDATTAAAAFWGQAQAQKPAVPAPKAGPAKDSGIGVGNAVVIGIVALAGLWMWPRVSRWLG